MKTGCAGAGLFKAVFESAKGRLSGLDLNVVRLLCGSGTPAFSPGEFFASDDGVCSRTSCREIVSSVVEETLTATTLDTSLESSEACMRTVVSGSAGAITVALSLRRLQESCFQPQGKQRRPVIVVLAHEL